jgi:translocation protein SEC63
MHGTKFFSFPSHPDKVRVTLNETVEMIQDRFVGLTKAYKS